MGMLAPRAWIEARNGRQRSAAAGSKQQRAGALAVAGHGSSRAAAKGSGSNWNWVGADWPTRCTSCFVPGFIQLQSLSLCLKSVELGSVSRRGHRAPPARASIGLV